GLSPLQRAPGRGATPLLGDSRAWRRGHRRDDERAGSAGRVSEATRVAVPRSQRPAPRAVPPLGPRARPLARLRASAGAARLHASADPRLAAEATVPRR